MSHKNSPPSIPPSGQGKSTGRRIGVYICYCGGNISDYVDVEKVREAIASQEGVVVAKTTMFACSDAAQQEIIEDIQQKKLDGLVVASCSPKLHLFTFRGAAERAGLNPYLYVQVNLREQDSWAHTDDPQGATEKAIKLVAAGIEKAKLTKPLKPFRLETVKRTLIIGAGIAGLRAAAALADLGIEVVVVEKEQRVGGWLSKFRSLYPHNQNGPQLVASLLEELEKKENVTLYTSAEIVEKKGCIGDFEVKIKTGSNIVTHNVGAIIVATGFENYQPSKGEFGYGEAPQIITLPEFKELVENSQGKGNLTYNGRPIQRISYIYCVGSRQSAGEEAAHTYCSRFCCNAAIHTALLVNEINPSIHQFHFYRDIRTYGKFEPLYEEACRQGSVFIRFAATEPPQVVKNNGQLKIKVKDLLTAGEELELDTDLIVLVTGMIPRENSELVNLLKLPLGKDGFFNEIHPKLRPVETVIDGVFIAGTSQGPKNLAESVASSLAATAKTAALLLKGYVELEPLIAFVDKERCQWCGLCAPACPYEAITKTNLAGKEIADVNRALCKGCGGCVPVCPQDALHLEGYTDDQVEAMIEALARGSSN
ncbi:MAG: 4Fe-4S ferredoxin [Candidatus Aminicenantes bacterium 4484_214]|nr:MAG: 4Fe-4S ferredoxin [Candidatus Aminicenantes bacterium 4484_214]